MIVDETTLSLMRKVTKKLVIGKNMNTTTREMRRPGRSERVG